MSADHDRILVFLKSQGARGATDREISDELGMALNSVRPRRLELVARGLVGHAPEQRMVTAGSSRIGRPWMALPAPHSSPPRSKTLTEALEPFLAKAKIVAESNPNLPRSALMPMVFSMGAIRDLIRAAGGSDA